MPWIGCGAGSFAARLAARARHVDAIDRAAHMVVLARERVPANVDVRVDDVSTAHLPAAHYDVVTSISVLHHVELTQVLPRLAEALRPGGLLIAVALPKIDLPRDVPVEAYSVVGHRLLGSAFRLEQRVMPRQDAVLTTRQVSAQSARVMPNVRVRRLPFWRYELRWQRPATPLR